MKNKPIIIVKLNQHLSCNPMKYQLFVLICIFNIKISNFYFAYDHICSLSFNITKEINNADNITALYEE